METILSTYLTAKGNPQGNGNKQPDDPTLVDTWYEGAKNYNPVIFHDELSEEFMANYPAVEFIKVGNYKYSANDARFEIFSEYLIEHEEVDSVFITDLFDVKVNCFPEVGDKLYVQQEERVGPKGEKTFWRPDWSWARHQLQNMYGTYDEQLRGLAGKSIYNAGCWGGSTEFVLFVCVRVMVMLDKQRTELGNCNMLAFNEVLYNEVGVEKIISGYPYFSKFKYYEEGADICFIHK